MTSCDVLIIGAGLCGITLAKSIQKKTVLLEKSKGVGGRIANRRIDNLGFDHGALYLKNSPEIINLMTSAKIDFKTDAKGIWIKGGMTQLPKKLSENLDIKKGVKAEKISKSTSGWTVTTDTNETFIVSKLVVTAPLPQALELLTKNHIHFPEALSNIAYTKAVMALIITKTPYVAPEFLPEYIESISEMSERDLHPNGLIIRATPEFSDEIFELADEVNLKTLVETFNRITPTTEVVSSELKKWRYVLPKESHPDPFLEVDSGLFLAGDAFYCPDVRGSIFSATSLAAKL